MATVIRRIGVLTSGGDAPGTNAVIRAVVKTAEIEYGWKVFGIENGFEGLLTPPRIATLGLDQVRGLLPLGGTILGSTNRGHFSTRIIDGVPRRDPAPYKEAARNMRLLGLDALVVIGGEGSQAIASDFPRYGIRAVGVPKTIDNDLWGSDRTFGFATALKVATDALDRLHTTAASHDRVMVLEVMGRDAGWIALHAGLGGGADIILIPEIPFTMDAVAAKVWARDYQDSGFSIIVVAEGARMRGRRAVSSDEASGRLGGIGRAGRRGVGTPDGQGLPGHGAGPPPAGRRAHGRRSHPGDALRLCGGACPGRGQRRPDRRPARRRDRHDLDG